MQSKFVEELAQQGRIRELILDQYANYVVQRALTVANNEEGLKLVNAIRPHLHSMQVCTSVALGARATLPDAGDRALLLTLVLRDLSSRSVLKKIEEHTPKPDPTQPNHVRRSLLVLPLFWNPCHVFYVFAHCISEHLERPSHRRQDHQALPHRRPRRRNPHAHEQRLDPKNDNGEGRPRTKALDRLPTLLYPGRVVSALVSQHVSQHGGVVVVVVGWGVGWSGLKRSPFTVSSFRLARPARPADGSFDRVPFSAALDRSSIIDHRSGWSWHVTSCQSCPFSCVAGEFLVCLSYCFV